MTFMMKIFLDYASLVPPEGKEIVMLILFRHPFDVGVKFIAQQVEKIAQLLPILSCPLA
jgi:hypothetical protein